MNVRSGIESLLHDSTRLLVIAPHPDDESLATGGLIQRARAASAEVLVILLTDGDMNPWPQRVAERRIFVTSADRARWGRTRRKEAIAALACLGVDALDVRHLGLPDMGLTRTLARDPAGACEPIAAFIREFAPTIVVAPSLRDAHPDHGAAHVLASLAITRAGSRAVFASYVVHGATDHFGEMLRLDAAAQTRKIDALQRHQTQLRLSRRRMLRYAERPERFDIEQPPASVRESGAVAVLPWQLSAAARPFVSLLVVTQDRSLRLSPAVGPSSRDSDASGCRRLAGGRLELRLSASVLDNGPVFARLESRVPSPWIYDRWGWTRLA